jgi:GNAT superfamily N-acetyltransferase
MTTVPIGLAEQTEIKAYGHIPVGAPAPLRETLGVASRRFGSVLATVVRKDPLGHFNRAAGFGADDPITVEVLTEVRDFFREQGMSAGDFMIAPSLLPPDWAAMAATLNLTEGTRNVKLGCETAAVLAAANRGKTLDPALRVGLVEPGQALEWGTVMMTNFGSTMPAMAEMAASCVGRPDYPAYAVYEGERIIATGSIFINGDCAGGWGGTTEPEARGRGAQSALIVALAQAAQAAGCRWLVADTGAEAPGEHNPSLHNMMRAGLELMYERVTWQWRA